MSDKEKKGFITEFKEFITRGNVIDMAVGVIVATAFGKITTSLVNDVFMPAIGMLIGGIDLGKLNIVLKPAVLDEAGAEIAAAVTLGIGTFITTIIDFILVALCVFIFIKVIAKMQNLRKVEEAPAEEETPAEPEPTKEELLLTEIRDLLKEK